MSAALSLAASLLTAPISSSTPNDDANDLFRSGRENWGLLDLEPAQHIRHVALMIINQETVNTGLPKNFEHLAKLQRPAELTLALDCTLDIDWYCGLPEDFVWVLRSLMDAGTRVVVMAVGSPTYSVSVSMEHLDDGAWSKLMRRLWHPDVRYLE